MVSYVSDKLDDLDQSILKFIQIEGRISNVELGQRIGLSPPAIHARIKRLEQMGYIQQYVTLLNRETLGFDLICFVSICLKSHHLEQMRHFEQAMQNMPEILECYHLTGEYDFLLKVVLRNRSDLERFVVERLSTITEVSRTNTAVVISETKSTTALPLD